jgi:predicted metal-dependent phosphoesterase TrpH
VAAIHAQGGLVTAAHPFLHAVSRSPDGFQARMGAGAALRRVPFDALEVNDSFPGLALANLRARRFNAHHCRLPLVGNSDAHVKEAIGCSYTRFPGRTAHDLAAAIRTGNVAPGWRPYGFAQYRAYFRFWRLQGCGRTRFGWPRASTHPTVGA